MSTFEDDVSSLENAVRLFAQTMKRPQRWAQVVAESGITIDRPSAVILQVLLAHEPNHLRVQDLALLLGIESPSVTRKTQSLAQDGYLERISDPKDGRAITLKVTRTGRAIARKIHKVQRQAVITALKDWPAADRHQFVQLFERFSNDLATTNPKKGY